MCAAHINRLWSTDAVLLNFSLIFEAFFARPLLTQGRRWKTYAISSIDVCMCAARINGLRCTEAVLACTTLLSILKLFS